MHGVVLLVVMVEVVAAEVGRHHGLAGLVVLLLQVLVLVVVGMVVVERWR